MAQIRSIEEYICGLDGDETKSIRPTLETVIKDAKAEGVERIMVEARTTPMNTTSSRQEFTAQFATSDPINGVIEALRKKLESSPGDAFNGKIRVNFKRAGDSSHYIGSYTRTMRAAIAPPGPQLDASGNALAAQGDLAKVANYFLALVKPQQEMNLRLMEAGASMLHAGAQVVAASKGPAASNTLPSGGGIAGDLLRGAMMMGQAEMNAQRGGGQAPQNGGGPPVPPPTPGFSGNGPPMPPGMQAPRLGPPGPGSYGDAAQIPGPTGYTRQITQHQQKPKTTRADVEQWARENQAEARSMVMQLVQQHGFVLMPAGGGG